MGHNIFLLPQTAALTPNANHSAYFTANWTNCDVFFTAKYANCTNYSYTSRVYDSVRASFYQAHAILWKTYYQRLGKPITKLMPYFGKPITKLMPTFGKPITKLTPTFGKPITKAW